MRFINNQFINMAPLDRMYSLPGSVLGNELSISHNFVEKKTRKLFRLKSIENRYRVSLSSLLFKKCTVIGTVVTFLQNIGIDIVVTFKVPSAQL